MVALREIASIAPGSGPQQINRKEQTREVLISANVQRRPPATAAAELRAKLDRSPCRRATVHYRAALPRTSGSLCFAVQALALAVVFIYLILASQFGSFIQPVAIMVSLPLSLIGVFWRLLAWRSTLNIFSIIGFIMLMGLVTKNAILLVDFVNQQRARGHGARRRRCSRPAEIRLRPILMTTLAMIFGMIPLALGVGEGGEQRAPMGQAVIGGVITSSLLTLVVVPVIYTYLDTLGTWFVSRPPAAGRW